MASGWHYSRIGRAMMTASVLTFSGISVAAQPGQEPAEDGPPVQAVEASEEAMQVAAAVQQFYEQTRGVEANFRQSYYYKLYERYERSQGRVTFLKPGMMRFQYAEPNGKTITSNGQHLWLYEPARGDEAAQCVQQGLASHQLPRAFSFLTGQGLLTEDFSFRTLDAQRYGYREGFVLELRPKEASPHYEKILFYVPRRDGRPSGVVRRVLIVDESGNRNRFDFSAMEWNPEVNASDFNFSPPGGLRCTQP